MFHAQLCEHSDSFLSKCPQTICILSFSSHFILPLPLVAHDCLLQQCKTLKFDVTLWHYYNSLGLAQEDEGRCWFSFLFYNSECNFSFVDIGRSESVVNGEVALEIQTTLLHFFIKTLSKYGQSLSCPYMKSCFMFIREPETICKKMV